jgi:hypothetical protein
LRYDTSLRTRSFSGMMFPAPPRLCGELAVIHPTGGSAN